MITEVPFPGIQRFSSLLVEKGHIPFLVQKMYLKKNTFTHTNKNTQIILVSNTHLQAPIKGIARWMGGRAQGVFVYTYVNILGVREGSWDESRKYIYT